MYNASACIGFDQCDTDTKTDMKTVNLKMSLQGHTLTEYHTYHTHYIKSTLKLIRVRDSCRCP